MAAQVRKKQLCCFGWAVALFLIGIVLITTGILIMVKILPDTVHDKILEKKVIGKNKDGSDNSITRTWKNPQYLTYMQYWVYNYTNPLEIQHRAAYPDMLEKGPYSYREYQSNNVDEWSEDGTEVFYRRKSVFVFDKAMSCSTCNPTDLFIVPDIIFFKVMNTLTDPNEIHDLICELPKISGLSLCDSFSLSDIEALIKNFSDVLSIAMKARGAGPFIPVTVGDLLFNGFDDPLVTRLANFALDILKEVVPLILKNGTLTDLIPDSLETPKANLNMNNDTLQVQYRMRTGKDDPYKAGEVLSFFDNENGTNSDGNLLPESWWSNPDEEQCPPELAILARRLNGTLGDFFKPFVEESDKLYLYVPEICRSLYMVYDSPVTIKGIDGMHFIMPNDVFNYDLNTNCGFCRRLNNDVFSKKKGQMCLPNGLLDISQCTNLNPPIAVSKPHFLGAAKEVLHMFPRIKQDVKRDEVSVDVEPNMGLVLKADKRLQINVIVSRYNITKTYNLLLPGTYPIVWLNESFLIDDGSVDELSSQLFNPQKLVKIVSWVLGVGLGIICIITSVLLIVCGIFCVSRRANKVVEVKEMSEFEEASTSNSLHQDTSEVRQRIKR